MNDETPKTKTLEPVEPSSWRSRFWPAVREYAVACGGDPTTDVGPEAVSLKLAAVGKIDELLIDVPGVDAQLRLDTIAYRVKSNAAIVAAVNLVEIAQRLAGGEVTPEERKKTQESLVQISESLVRLVGAKA